MHSQQFISINSNIGRPHSQTEKYYHRNYNGIYENKVV